MQCEAVYVCWEYGKGGGTGGGRGESDTTSAASLWGTSPFADMRAEPPVGRRSPTHQRVEAVAVLAGRAVVHRLRREGWRRAKGRQVDTVLRAASVSAGHSLE